MCWSLRVDLCARPLALCKGATRDVAQPFQATPAPMAVAGLIHQNTCGWP